MKTIVIVHHTGNWGGGTKSLVDLCEMLRDDYHVVVCIPRGYPEFKEKITRYGYKVCELDIPVPFTNIYSGRPPLISGAALKSLNSLRMIKRFSDVILTLNPDIVIFNTLVTAVSSVYLSRFTKVVCIDRETLTSDISIAIYRRLLDKKLDAITFLSEYEMKKLSFRTSESVVFPDCVRMDKIIDADKPTIRLREGIPQDKYVILFMGGLAKIKGTDIILKAMDILDDRFLLIFAGDMNESKLSKRQLVHDVKYPSHYLFKKRVKKYYYKLKGTSKFHEVGLSDSVDELIVASDIVVFPSTSVHQPRPCIEAGAYGKPVLISDYKETKEYFINGYNALTFKPGDAKDMAEKLLYAFNNQELMKKQGRNNRIMTVTKHNFDDGQKVIGTLLEKVCSDED